MPHTSLDRACRLEQLDRFFRPRSIALVGASERSIWSTSAHENLVRADYGGRIHAINRNGGTVHGIAAATSCAAIGESIDAALLLVPEGALLEALDDLKSANVAGAVILSAGFAELGAVGQQRQEAVAEAARRAGVRLLGPNCLGFVNFSNRVPLWTVPQRQGLPNPTIAVLSQSGAMAGTIERFAFQQRIGLTHLISTGNEADITIAEALDYLVERSDAKVIALFLESVRDSQGFLEATDRARSVGKAIVLLKVGASEAAAKAAQAHTGSLVGNDRVFNAMCRRSGLTRVFSIEELVITADVFARIGPVRGEGPAVIAMSGGLCEVAVDQAEAEGTLIPVLSDETIGRLREKLPAFATPNNPLDITGAAMKDPQLIAMACTELAVDPKVGMLSYAFDVPAKDDKRGFSSGLINVIAEGFRASGKPGLIISPGFTSISEEARAMTDAAGVAYCGGGVSNALKAIGNLFRWSKHLAKAPAYTSEVACTGARPITERDVLKHLAAHGVPVIPGELARSAEEAAVMANSFETAVVLKISSADIQHKTEVGGVVLRLAGSEAVREGYTAIVARVAKALPDARIDGVIVSPMRAGGTELFVGTMNDPEWGPAIAVGLGGVFVEVLKDTSLRLLPLTEHDALEMLDELRGKALLNGFRGAAPVDRIAVARAIVAIGNAALALGPRLISLEVNPILATEHGVEALDGLTVWEDI